MAAIVSWLEKEPRSFMGVARTIIFFLVFNVVYNLLVTPLVGLPLPGKPTMGFDFLFGALFRAPVEEEMLFRGLPLILVGEWARYRQQEERFGWLLIVSVISSLIFGFLHGGWINVALHGVSGLTVCLLFLKTGGWHGNYEKAIVAVFVIHFMYNGIITIYNFFLL